MTRPAPRRLFPRRPFPRSPFPAKRPVLATIPELERPGAAMMVLAIGPAHGAAIGAASGAAIGAAQEAASGAAIGPTMEATGAPLPRLAIIVPEGPATTVSAATAGAKMKIKRLNEPSK